MKEQPVQALLVVESESYARLIEDHLAGPHRLRFSLEWVRTFAQARERLKSGGVDVVLLDLSLADSQGLENVQKTKLIAPRVPILVLSSTDDESLALEAVHIGAQDYLVKDQLTGQLLARTIRYAIERKQSEVALLQLEEKYRSIFENTVEGIFQTSPEGCYLSANPPLARIYGYPSPDALMAELTDIADQLYVDHSRRTDFIRLMEQNDVVTNFESRIYRKDGSIIWISENVRAVRDEREELRYYEGTVQDITERKQAEENLRNSETLYHSLVENLPQNIFRKDLNERFTFANQRFCLTLGRPLEDILGKTDFDFFPPELAAKYQRDDRLILETGKIFETIEEHHPPRGEKIYVNVVKTPIYDAERNIIGLQGIFWDITEKKRAEEQAARAHAELAKNREELRAKNQQMEEDLVMAREIQQAILPQQYPTFPRGVEAQDSALGFCHRYFPTGAVGGDFFNVVAVSDSKAGVFICDVMGHGVRSALVTAIMRALVEELTPLATDPGQLLAQINRDLRTILKQTGTPMFTTAFYMLADLEKMEIHFANAGHPKPLLVRRSAGEVLPLQNLESGPRPALGLFDKTVYPPCQCTLEPGDFIMLFTDGLYDVEGPKEEMFNTDWVFNEVKKRIQQPVSQLFDEILEQIKQSSPEGRFADDVCLVGMEVRRALPPAPVP